MQAFTFTFSEITIYYSVYNVLELRFDMLKIREFRKSQKMTIKALAELSGMSISYISQIERGEIDPSLSSLRKIAAGLQVPMYMLLDDVVEWLAHFPNLEVVLIGRDLDDNQNEQLAANEKLIVVDDVSLVDDMTVEEILSQPKYAGLITPASAPEN